MTKLRQITLLHRRTTFGLALAAAALTAVSAPAATSAASLYPDLKTVAPKELRFDTVVYQGVTRKVLRFSNTAWNAGQGALELRGSPGGGTVRQRIYDDAGGYSDVPVGTDFIFHAGHNHFHFQDFAEYGLWTKQAYDEWLASGRSAGQAQRIGAKTTFCIMDTTLIQQLLGTPSQAGYGTCGPNVQGLSVGWGDTYRYYLNEQWIDLGESFLPDGQYVLRSVADPRNKLYESDNRGDATRESDEANEAITVFTVRRGKISNSKR